MTSKYEFCKSDVGTGINVTPGLACSLGIPQVIVVAICDTQGRIFTERNTKQIHHTQTKGRPNPVLFTSRRDVRLRNFYARNQTTVSKQSLCWPKFESRLA